MKTSVVAVVAASLFLIAAFFGIGAGHGTPPPPPQMISLTGAQPGAVSLPFSDLTPTPSVPGSLSASPSDVLAVGHGVQQRSLKDLTASTGSGTNNGTVDVALGGTTGDQSSPIYVNTTISALPPARGTSPTPAATTTPALEPTPTRSLPVFIPPTHRPRPEPTPIPTPSRSPTPSPTPTPTPTPTAVTVTVTPPVTSTATPSLVLSPTPIPTH